MSIIKRNRPHQAGWRITAATLLAALLPIVNAAAQPGRARPRIASGPTFRLAGRHTFTITHVRKTDVINWQVDREETPEGGGASTLTKSIATAQGANASFDLAHHRACSRTCDLREVVLCVLSELCVKQIFLKRRAR